MGSRDWKLGTLNRTQKQIQGLSQPGVGGVPALKDNSGLIEMARQKQEADAEMKRRGVLDSNNKLVTDAIGDDPSIYGAAQIEALRAEWISAKEAGDTARMQGVEKAMSAIMKNDSNFGKQTIVDVDQEVLSGSDYNNEGYITKDNLPDWTGSNQELMEAGLTDESYAWFKTLLED